VFGRVVKLWGDYPAGAGSGALFTSAPKEAGLAYSRIVNVPLLVSVGRSRDMMIFFSSERVSILFPNGKATALH